MKKVCRWILVQLIGIVGVTAPCIGVWCAYLSHNNDWLILAIFGALVMWFYVEVAAPDNRTKVVKKVDINDLEYTSIFKKNSNEKS